MALLPVIQTERRTPPDYDFKAFLCTCDRDEVEDLSVHYPDDGTLRSFSKTTKLWGGIVQEP